MKQVGSYKAGKSCPSRGKEHSYEDRGSYWKCVQCGSVKSKPKGKSQSESRKQLQNANKSIGKMLNQVRKRNTDVVMSSPQLRKLKQAPPKILWTFKLSNRLDREDFIKLMRAGLKYENHEFIVTDKTNQAEMERILKHDKQVRSQPQVQVPYKEHLCPRCKKYMIPPTRIICDVCMGWRRPWEMYSYEEAVRKL